MAGRKKVADSIAVKMKGFAQNVFAGMSVKTTDDIVKNLEKQGLKAEQIYGSKNTKKAMEAALNHTKETFGYQVGDFIGGGIRETMKDYNKAKEAYAKKAANGLKGEALEKYNPSLMTAIKKGHSKFDKDGKRLGYDMKAVAGTAVAGSMAGRVVTGGGLYRDRYGNVNVPGVPFI